jgi:DNA-binding MarR family transcriptional regulator
MTDDEPMSDADYGTLARFRHVLRAFAAFSEEAARDAGIAPAQYQLLVMTRGWGGEGDPSISDLAERLVLRHHSVVELVQRARIAGLVETVGDPEDGRRQRVRLTPAGTKKLAVLARLHRDELRRFREDLAAVYADLR